jgi:competence protein ComEC
VFHKEIPFLRIGISLCSGIVFGYYFSPDNTFFIAAGIVLIAAFIVSRFYNRSISNQVFGISFTFALFIAGLFLYTREKSSISRLRSEEAYFAGYLSDYPEEKENTFKMTFRMESGFISGNQVPLKGSLLLYHKKNSACLSYLPGDRFIIKCRPLEITNRGNPYEFDYRFYMQCQDIKYYAFTDSSDILGHSTPDRRKLVHRALIIRERIINMFRERGLEGERLALVAAITLGQKNLLDPEQKQFFIKAGVMHIMAVSGLHAVILSVFIFRILFFLKGRFNILRVILTLVILWLFAFVTGLTPSVLRATMMFSFLQAGNIMKRPVNGVNSVLASAFVLIMIKPSVIFDAGFQLSYTAVIYIICFYRDLYVKLRFRHKIPDLIWQSVAVTVIAQAGTLPLTVMLFNRFPVWFILSNVIIVPVSSLVIIMGCLAPIVYPVRFFSEILTWVLGNITGLTEFLTEKAASLPFSTISSIGMNKLECILLTVTIFLFLMFLLKRKSVPIRYPLVALLLFILTGTFKTALTRNTAEFIVYNSIGSTTIGIRNGKLLSIFSDTCCPGTEVTRHSAMLDLKVRTRLIEGQTSLIRAGTSNILITSNLTKDAVRLTSPDILIIRGKSLIDKDLRLDRKLDAVIVSPEAAGGALLSAIIRSIPTDTVHFVRQEGAFYLKL